MASRLPKTLTDYTVIAIIPALIMLLVGSLVFFLLTAFYQGEFQTRLLFIFGLFVLAAVLIGRISMEQGTEYAAMFALPLALVTAVAMWRFVELQGPLAGFGWLINLGLMGLVWWSAHKLTWDCTLIDEHEDAAGEGLLQSVGLDTETAAADQREVEQARLQQLRSRPGEQETSWWQRLLARRNRPHAPGKWVVYFSLAALPLFGFGQWFIPTEDIASRRFAFQLLFVYVASGLALLLTTSFLNLRRYLRQRRLEMPPEMAAVWLGAGAALILILLVFCSLLPRPSGEFELSQMPFRFGAPDSVRTSRYGFGNDGPVDPQQATTTTSRPDHPATTTGGQQSNQGGQQSNQGGQQSNQGGQQSSQGGQQSNQGGQQASQGGQQASQGGQQSNQGGQQASQGGQQSNQGGQQSSQGGQQASQGGQQSSQGGQQASQGGQQSNQGGQQSNQGGQQSSQGGQQSSQGGQQSSQGGQQSSQGGQQASQGGQQPNQGGQQSNQGGQQASQGGQQASQGGQQSGQAGQRPPERQAASSPASRGSSSRPSPSLTLGGLGNVLGWLLKLLFYAGLLGVGGYLAWRHRESIMAAMNRLLREFREFWQRLLGGGKSSIDSDDAAPVGLPPRPFSDYANPFSPNAPPLPPSELVRHSFEALEAWAREHGCPRQVQQTPHEFARQIAHRAASMRQPVHQLAELYARIAYAGASVDAAGVEPLRELWRVMQTFRAAPLPAGPPPAILPST
jgi:hypothetical protein